MVIKELISRTHTVACIHPCRHRNYTHTYVSCRLIPEHKCNMYVLVRACVRMEVLWCAKYVPDFISVLAVTVLVDSLPCPRSPYVLSTVGVVVDG